MIAGAPLSPEGCRALAALIALRGDGPLSAALRSKLPSVDDPQRALAELLALRRPAGPPAGRPHPEGPSPAARYLRRLGRRHRVSPHRPPPAPDAEALEHALRDEPDPGRRRALVAAAPLAVVQAWKSRRWGP